MRLSDVYFVHQRVLGGETPCVINEKEVYDFAVLCFRVGMWDPFRIFLRRGGMSATKESFFDDERLTTELRLN